MNSSFYPTVVLNRYRHLLHTKFGKLFAIFPILLCLVSISEAQRADVSYSAINYGGTRLETRQRLMSLERQVFELINAERVTHGKDRLAWDDRAAATARLHSADMAQFNYFSHLDLAGGRVSHRSARVGLDDWREIGENISWLSGYDDPAGRAVRGWMNSSSHRQNILHGKYRQAGVGLAVSSGGKYYFTQVFVRR